MEAILLKTGTDDVFLSEFPDPVINNPTDVKLKVLQVGICGTDREEACGGRADAPAGEKNLIIGHEMIGQVLEVGKEVKDFKKGDYAVFTVRRGCGKCEACKVEVYDMCYTGDYKERGIKSLHGFQSTYVVDDQKYLIKVPESIHDIAVLTEPTTVVEKAIDESCKIQVNRLPAHKNHRDWLRGKTALIAGLGPIGLLGAVVLRLHGCNVLGLDIVDENSARPQILKELGGTYLNSKEHSMESIQKQHPQIDLILEAAGIPKLDFDLVQTLGINGIYVLTGVPGDGPPLQVNGASVMKQLVLKNQVIFGSVNASFSHFKMAVDDLENGLKKWPNTLPKIISHRIPHKDFKKVLAKHTSDEIKVVIDWEK
ncbi:alcohol dehydrogenase [Candidatus Aerophobetes bacterium]|uniref:Alcohol dehydrogenase n=1 Tax=Aerophobetes bacterium TaxID=2030807 RepID=A0A2A4YBF4_UNCAE|nr:MAG: alcohol dehydrogenase [Candidatus Aerophobetes bacterium]